METGAVPEDSWSGQPTEEERMAWEDKRQQREKLSNRMGQYLLKGYRMLSSNCDHCGNILLSTRDGVNFCVNCTEIEETMAPAKRTKNAAAGAQALGVDAPTSTRSAASHSDLPSNERGLLAELDVVQKDKVGTRHLVDRGTASTGPLESHGSLKPVVATQKVLLSKLQWATKELASTSSVEYSTQLCQLIKACADALQSIEYFNTSTDPTAA